MQINASKLGNRCIDHMRAHAPNAWSSPYLFPQARRLAFARLGFVASRGLDRGTERQHNAKREMAERITGVKDRMLGQYLSPFS